MQRSYARGYSSERALPVNLLAGGEGGAASPASALDAFAPVALPPSPAALVLAALALSNSSSPVAPGHAARAAVDVRRTSDDAQPGQAALKLPCVSGAHGTREAGAHRPWQGPWHGPWHGP